MGDNRRSIRTRDILHPDRILSSIIDDYISGNFTDYQFLFRAIVVKIDMVGGQLSGPGTKNTSDFINPKNSIQARIISKDRYKENDDLSVFWPIFSHDVMPLKEGEHVYVMFENPNEQSRGVWLSRVPEPKDVNSSNLVLGSEKYKNSSSSTINLEQSVADMDVAPSPFVRSPEFVAEKIPTFTPRTGDRVIEGSNNTIIVMGRDRPDVVTSGEKKDAGTISIVTGRSKPDDLDLVNDKSVVYISSDTDIDKNIGTDKMGTNAQPTAAIAIKSNEIRIVASKGMKVVVQGGDLILEGQNILIGDKASESAVLGDSLKTLLDNIIKDIGLVNSAIPSLTPVPVLSTSIPPKPILSKTVKVKS